MTCNNDVEVGEFWDLKNYKNVLHKIRQNFVKCSEIFGKIG